MVSKLTDDQMAKRAVLMRARGEASIVRAIFLNEVLPAVEREFDRRTLIGESIGLTVPPAEDFARAYVDAFFASNTKALK